VADTVTLDWTWLPHQRRFFDFDPPDGIETGAMLGGWGSGKTTALARKAIKIASMNPWRPTYGGDHPTGLIVAPTYRIMRHATQPAFERALPRAAIKRQRGQPHNDCVLNNGFRFLFYSGEGELEGITACMVAIDEIHHPSYQANPARFMNLVARVRDPEAQRLAILVAGLPESGWVRDTFDRQGPNRITVLSSMLDNVRLPKAARDNYLDSCPGGFEEMYIRGLWMAPKLAIYPQFSEDLHVVDTHVDRRVPVHIGLDVGNFGCAVIAQEIDIRVRNVVGQESKETGLLVVDEMLFQDQSVEAMCYAIKTQAEWFVRPQVSRICVDPTIRRDELAGIRKHFPNCHIEKRDRGDELFPIESGIRLVQRALRDALGNTRLFFHRKVAKTKRGCVDAVQRYRRHDKTMQPIKDNLRDHATDALRYLVCDRLQSERQKIRVVG